MTISRRTALTGASAVAFLGGSTELGAASVARRAMSAIVNGGRYRNTQTSQRFLQLLIHQDETRHMPYSAEISIRAKDTAWYAINTLSDVQYGLTNKAYKKRGYRLKFVNAFKTRDGVRYAACWELASGPDWNSRHGMTLSQFQAANSDFAGKGFRLSYLDTRAGYAAMWERGDVSSQQILSGLAQSDFEQQHTNLVGQGYRPERISVHAEQGAPRFAAIYEKDSGSTWKSAHQMSAANFHKTDAALKSQGYRLVDASGYMQGHNPTFSGIWGII